MLLSRSIYWCLYFCPACLPPDAGSTLFPYTTLFRSPGDDDAAPGLPDQLDGLDKRRPERAALRGALGTPFVEAVELIRKARGRVIVTGRSEERRVGKEGRTRVRREACRTKIQTPVDGPTQQHRSET